MLVTSDNVKAILAKLVNEKEELLSNIRNNSVFIAAVTENIDEVRPEFDLTETLKKINEIDLKVVKLRHARNIFNSQSVIEGTGFTIDEALVRVAELTNLSQNVYSLARKLQKERMSISSSKDIEYRYANYDVDLAKKYYQEIEDEKRQLLTRLDYHNATVTFEIEE